ncbi:MAG: tetratricopeptide repeat protein, partial [Rudaea sp.]
MAAQGADHRLVEEGSDFFRCGTLVAQAVLQSLHQFGFLVDVWLALAAIRIDALGEFRQFLSRLFGTFFAQGGGTSQAVVLGYNRFGESAFWRGMEDFEDHVAIRIPITGSVAPMKSLLSRFRRSTAPLPRTPETPEALEALITEGNSCEDRGEYATARELYQRAVAMSPHSARAHMNLGNALAGLRNAPAALECYRRAIALKPQWLPAHLNLGALLLAADDLAAAESAYRRALEIAPESASAWTG